MTARVLFVDDEPKILQGLRRSLRGMRKEWDMAFADGGAEALEVLAGQPFDAVVTDMSMPGMDGAQLLNEVARRQPRTIRFILSGEADREMTYRTVGVSHRFLPKPCDPEALIASIDAPLAVRAEIGADQLALDVSFLDRLQSPSSVFEALQVKLREPELTPRDVASIISRDPSLSARLLQLVNSAYFGRSITTCSIKRAVDVIGTERLAELLSRKRLGIGKPGRSDVATDPQAMEDDWHLAARAAAIARGLDVSPDDIDAVYATALFINLGASSATGYDRAPDERVIAAPSAAYATALLGFPERLTRALRALSGIRSRFDDIAVPARLICETVLSPGRAAA